MQIKRRRESLRLAENILGHRYPMRFGQRPFRYRWNNPKLAERMKRHDRRITPSIRDRATFEYRLVSSVLDEQAGPPVKRTYRGCLSTRRRRGKHDPRMKLDNLRMIAGNFYC